MKVHLDGARLANAAVSLEVPLGAVTTDAGVDVVSFGGTKNGLLFGEAVVTTDPGVAESLRYLRKMNMQLASKMRFISAQLVAILTDGLWMRSAAHANAMARRMAAAVAEMDGVTITQPTQANSVYAALPRSVAERLRSRFAFYDWDVAHGVVRWMCAFDTTERDVDAFVGALREALGEWPGEP